MRDAREFSARTGDSLRWFIYTLSFVMPILSLAILGPWLGILAACASVGFWLWWIRPPIGQNCKPVTLLVTFILIFASAIVVLGAENLLERPAGQRSLL